MLKTITKHIKLLLHRGDKYLCPFCGYSSKKLLPIGKDLPIISEKGITGAGLRSAVCMKCGSNDRERLIYAYLFNELKINRNPDEHKILHIAPEPNLAKQLSQLNLLKYDRGDLFMPGYTYPINVKNMDITALNQPEGQYDIVICNHVLEHVKNDKKAMSEIYRVLSYSGLAILQVPLATKMSETYEDSSITESLEREKHYTRHDHLRLYGMDYEEKLKEAGFKVKKFQLSNKYSNLGLNENEQLYVGFKF